MCERPPSKVFRLHGLADLCQRLPVFKCLQGLIGLLANELKSRMKYRHVTFDEIVPVQTLRQLFRLVLQRRISLSPRLAVAMRRCANGRTKSRDDVKANPISSSPSLAARSYWPVRTSSATKVFRNELRISGSRDLEAICIRGSFSFKIRPILPFS